MLVEGHSRFAFFLLCFITVSLINAFSSREPLFFSFLFHRFFPLTKGLFNDSLLLINIFAFHCLFYFFESDRRDERYSCVKNNLSYFSNVCLVVQKKTLDYYFVICRILCTLMSKIKVTTCFIVFFFCA